jgi:hypothetical protein
MVLRAKLKLVLKADDVVVAESDDPQIWSAAFAAIHEGLDGRTFGSPPPQDEPIQWVPQDEQLAIRSLAEELNVEVKEVMAACHPRTIAPYIFLNRHHWEAFKRQTPERGRNAVSNAVLAMTLLLLWGEQINLDRVTLRDGMAVLRTISARDDHASRAVENCAWLQRSSGSYAINPDETSTALAVGRAFCLKQPPEWGESEKPCEETAGEDA